MLTDARWKLLKLVNGLSVEQLDHMYDAHSNSIGVLLGHLVARELQTQTILFDSPALCAEEARNWESGTELWYRARFEMRGYGLNHYTAALEKVRDATLVELAQRDDLWLDQAIPQYAQPANVYYVLFHLIEDELCHRGQIVWLRNRLAGLHPQWWTADQPADNNDL